MWQNKSVPVSVFGHILAWVDKIRYLDITSNEVHCLSCVCGLCYQFKLIPDYAPPFSLVNKDFYYLCMHFIV